ncbi:MAG: ATP-binding protein [Candidatus Dormibacteraceae bacterium]
MRELQPMGRSRRRGWSVRRYMVLFTVVLLAVSALAGVAVRTMGEQDARQSAIADASYAARAASAQIAAELVLLQETTARLAGDPQASTVLGSPSGPCSLTFEGGGPFSIGHLDIIKSDGSVRCSSQPVRSGSVYGAAEWLPASTHSPITVAPFLDPVTNQVSAVVAAPVAGADGTVAAIVELAPVGPNLAATLGGARQLEFLVTTKDNNTVLARSLQPARWVGQPLAGTAFSGSADQVERPDLDGRSRLYASSAVGSAPWKVYSGADEGAALAAGYLSSNRELAIILGGMGIMLIVIFAVYRRIVDPIQQLSLVIRGATPGDSLDAVDMNGATEVTGLAEDFGKLMATVKSELTERLSSEQTAIVSERNYRMLFEDHPEPMWLYDVDTFAVLEVNESALARYGYSRDEFLAMTIKDIRPPQDIPKFLELLAKPMPRSDRTGPWRHLLKDGSTIQVLITSHAVTFGEHNARFVLAEDLTESRRLELELAESHAHAENSAELSRAKDEMVSMVSHELRTPLASIVGFAELLATRDVSAAQRKTYLAVMLQEGRRLTALVNDFLDLRRLEGGHLSMRFAPADLSALITRAVELFNSPGSVPIEARLPDKLPLVRVDSDSMFRVLANLLSNARKYSPLGGSIVVGAGVVDGMAEVYVQDRGLGIPAEALSMLFGRFYRVESPDRHSISGTGLGLAICKNIVESHGGQIGARSEGLGKGARFYFTVPMVRQQAQTGDVLVVEDDSGFADLLGAELMARGLSALWAPDAETARHLMMKSRAVVLDLVLPGLPGEDFLRELRAARGAGIPVVVVTLKDLDPAANLSLQKVGVTAVLRKGPGTAASAATLIARCLASELVAI